MRSESACLGVYLAIAITLLGAWVFEGYLRQGHFTFFVFLGWWIGMWVAVPAAICASITVFPLFHSGFIESLAKQIAMFLLVAFGFSVMAWAILAPSIEL